MPKKPTNALLVKVITGKGKQSVYDLPPEGHVYGQRSERETAKEPTSAAKPEKKKQTGLDYISMNINTTRAQIIDAKGARLYRLAHPIHLIGEQTVATSKYSPKAGVRPKGHGPLPSDSDPSFTYGRHSEVCIPVGQLISEQFQHTLVIKEITAEDRAKAKAMLEKKHDRVVSRKKALPKKKGILDVDPKSLWKLNKFKNIDKKTFTQYEAKPILV